MKVVLILVLLISLELGMASAHTGSGAEHHHDEMIGEPGRPDQMSRGIDVEMDDTMRFTPSHIAVRQGETIRFAVTNGGKLRHEMVIGSLAALKAHAMHMAKFPGMKHSAPNQLSLEPGKTGEIFWHFTEAGNFHFGCLQAGHLEAGMIGSIEVK